MTDAWGGRRVTVTPPERGVFPLDHEHECRATMKSFLLCLKQNNGDHFPCKNVSESYLQCRMDSGLMSKEDLSTLGFGKDASYQRIDPNEGEKEKKGFVAGTGVRASPWFSRASLGWTTKD